MCRTFDKLPNDPQVSALKPIQVDWINWNLQQEAEAMNIREGGAYTIENSKDVPAEILGKSKGKGSSAHGFLGKDNGK